jgi:hypothetical protein
MNTSNTVFSPLTRGESFTLSALADTFMACYQGRDPSFGNRLSFIVQQLGHKVASEIDADDVDDFLEALQKRGKLFNRGGSKRGGQINLSRSDAYPLPTGTDQTQSVGVTIFEDVGWVIVQTFADRPLKTVE